MSAVFTLVPENVWFNSSAEMDWVKWSRRADGYLQLSEVSLYFEDEDIVAFSKVVIPDDEACVDALVNLWRSIPSLWEHIYPSSFPQLLTNLDSYFEADSRFAKEHLLLFFHSLLFPSDALEFPYPHEDVALSLVKSFGITSFKDMHEGDLMLDDLEGYLALKDFPISQLKICGPARPLS